MEFREQLAGFFYSWFYDFKNYASLKDPGTNLKYSILALFVLMTHMTMAAVKRGVSEQFETNKAICERSDRADLTACNQNLK